MPRNRSPTTRSIGRGTVRFCKQGRVGLTSAANHANERKTVEDFLPERRRNEPLAAVSHNRETL